MTNPVDNALSLLALVGRQVVNTPIRNNHVSAWSVGQHIEHVVKATSALAVMIMRNSKMPLTISDSRHDVRSIKEAVLTKGFFQRGLVEAPLVTHPSAQPDTTDLKKAILKCSNRLSMLSSIGADAVVHHPYLGTMERDEAIHFMAIHLKHHLSIIDDIVKGS